MHNKNVFWLLMLLLVGCTYSPPKPQINPGSGPVLESFTINGQEVVSGYGPIIGQSGQLKFVAKANTGRSLSAISIERKKHGENTVLLATCVLSPCEYEWDVSNADNGVYSFFVTIVDSEDVTLKVPFKDSLSIAIDNSETSAE